MALTSRPPELSRGSLLLTVNASYGVRVSHAAAAVGPAGVVGLEGTWQFLRHLPDGLASSRVSLDAEMLCEERVVEALDETVLG